MWITHSDQKKIACLQGSYKSIPKGSVKNCLILLGEGDVQGMILTAEQLQEETVFNLIEWLCKGLKW